MKTLSTASAIRQLVEEWRLQGIQLALVPTMGCLHNGHQMLMRTAKGMADRVIVSLFVNPIQFGPHEDYASYPRQFEADCLLAEKEGVAAIFHPSVDEMYGPSFQTSVRVEHLSQGLCGAGRPGHFDGVATVVCKLLQLTKPHLALFGEKDLQQLAIVRQMVKDLNFPVEIVGHPIVREPDGLAMSSRNRYLSPVERQQALCLSQAIAGAQRLVASAPRPLPAATVVAFAKDCIARAGVTLEYAEVVNQVTLHPEEVAGPESVLALAAKVGGRVRLIDNGRLLENRA